MLKRFYWAELTYRPVCLGEKRCCWPCYNQQPLCLERGYICERPNIVRGLINIWLATDPIIHVSSIGTEWIKVRPVGCKQMICLRCWRWCIGINSTLKRNQSVSAKLQRAFCKIKHCNLKKLLWHIWYNKWNVWIRFPFLLFYK